MKARKRNDGFCFAPLRVPRDCNVNQTINKTQHTGSTTSRKIRTPVITFPMLPEETRVSIIQCVLNDCGLFYQPYETLWGEREKKGKNAKYHLKKLALKLWLETLNAKTFQLPSKKKKLFYPIFLLDLKNNPSSY